MWLMCVMAPFLLRLSVLGHVERSRLAGRLSPSRSAGPRGQRVQGSCPGHALLSDRLGQSHVTWKKKKNLPAARFAHCSEFFPLFHPSLFQQVCTELRPGVLNTG